MKKILVLSDTHSYLHPGVKQYAEDCDEIWHAGDIGDVRLLDQLEAIKPLRAVYGNIDGHEIRIRCPEEQRFICEGVKVWMTHIGGHPQRYKPGIEEVLKSIKPDVFICGHSHILKVSTDKKHRLLYMNPGAAGIYGVQQVSTLLRFTVADKEVKNLEVVELKRRPIKA